MVGRPGVIPDSDETSIVGGKTISRAVTRAVEVVRKEMRKCIASGNVPEVTRADGEGKGNEL